MTATLSLLYNKDISPIEEEGHGHRYDVALRDFGLLLAALARLATAFQPTHADD